MSNTESLSDKIVHELVGCVLKYINVVHESL